MKVWGKNIDQGRHSKAIFSFYSASCSMKWPLLLKKQFPKDKTGNISTTDFSAALPPIIMGSGDATMVFTVVYKLREIQIVMTDLHYPMSLFWGKLLAGYSLSFKPSLSHGALTISLRSWFPTSHGDSNIGMTPVVTLSSARYLCNSWLCLYLSCYFE
jgi:hypothetical protein